ncbi:hypothetical protein Salmuc_04565 [Salipiger mucosus DSM 16094]|uniref:Uncharacterized protein n=1 Tax=Salipiger mucosus DSM 16094 TaxID=1123237 RepID=S9Q6L8_9RHOB|nr:hypothetical protein Salmuc_04565 [Salipiger mucosus DSM 16094]
MTGKGRTAGFDARCMVALLDYVERYGLTPLAREALVRMSRERAEPE